MIVSEILQGRYAIAAIIIALASMYLTYLNVKPYLKRRKKPKPPYQLNFFGMPKTPISWELRSPDGTLIDDSEDFNRPKAAVLDALFSMQGDVYSKETLSVTGHLEIVDLFHSEYLRLQGY